MDFGSAFSTQPIGVHGGLYLRIAPPVGMGGQLEVLYTEKNTPVQNGEEVANVRLNYLEVPLFAVFPFGPLDLQFGGYEFPFAFHGPGRSGPAGRRRWCTAQYR